MVLERLEGDPHEARQSGTPGRPPLEELGTRQRDDEQRVSTGPPEHRLDELDHPRVRPVDVFEHHHGWGMRRDRLEEPPPRSLGFSRLETPGRLQAQQDLEGRLHPVTIDLADESADRLCELLSLRVVVVGLRDPR